MISSKMWIEMLAAKYPNCNQAELARLIGVSKASVTHWNTGKHSISEEAATKIAELLKVPAMAVISTSLYERTENAVLKALYDATQQTLLQN